MRLLALYLRNFRNYEEASIVFSPKINYIYGGNAQGKTNLLEAIYLLITGRSFRTHHLTELIRFGASAFFLEAYFEKNGIEQVLKMSCDKEGRKIWHNATAITSLSTLLGILQGVVLSPEDRELIRGSPSIRRQFLDLQIAIASPLYLHHLARFCRAMKQRNALLKEPSEKTIEVWEEQMAYSAAYLTLEREKVVKALEIFGKPLQSALSGGKDELSLSYKSSALTVSDKETDSLQSYFLMQMRKLRAREREIGSTLTGPHRDDLEILLYEKEARYFASEGQKRCCTAALRLAEWLRLKEAVGEAPIMCIDDATISLDPSREHHLYSQLGELGQVFLTSPHRDAFLLNETCFIQVEGGHFKL